MRASIGRLSGWADTVTCISIFQNIHIEKKHFHFQLTVDFRSVLFEASNRYRNIQAMSSAFAQFPAELHINSDRITGPYPPEFKTVLSHDAAREALSQISEWSGYAQTPLVRLRSLEDKIDVGQIHYKQEADRFGLGSFKALGGAYAVFRLLAARIQQDTGSGADVKDLLSGKHATIVGDVTVTCATDGNHGRSVAWGARMFGCKAVIFIHETVSAAREEAIAAYGADVVRTKGNYDDSVREAARTAAENGWSVVSDTSYPGYIDVPRNVMQGYSVMVEEALRQLNGLRPTHVFIQGGVGGLAAAVTAHTWEAFGADAPVITVVEPDKAACLLESAKAGEPRGVGGDLDTIMAGLACGEPSIIAWPILAQGAAAFMSIPDEAAAEAMRLLASGAGGAKLVGGESGVAGLAGLLAAAEHTDMREAIGLTADSIILLIGSEGDTDPELYQKIVGQSGRAVEAGQ
ncbi:diaminopropionate ammonia-lyase [Mesorhizobium sp. 10J20-29]